MVEVMEKRKSLLEPEGEDREMEPKLKAHRKTRRALTMSPRRKTQSKSNESPPSNKKPTPPRQQRQRKVQTREQRRRQPAQVQQQQQRIMTRSRSTPMLPSALSDKQAKMASSEPPTASPLSFRNQVSQMVGLVSSFLPTFKRAQN